MSHPEVVIEVSSNPRLAQDLAAGGVFVPGCSFKLNSECELVVKGTAGELRLIARVVYSDPTRGTGFELLRLDEEIKAQLVSVIGAPIELPMRRPPSNPPMRHPTPPVGLPPARRSTTTPPAAVPVAARVAVELPDAPVHAAAGVPVSTTHESVDLPVPEVHTERFDALDLEPEPTEPLSLEEPEPEAEPAGELELEGEDVASEELPPDVEAAINKASGGSDTKFARNIHERLRGLTLIQQIKLAQSGRDSERIILERMYGKNVWEALLRNPRLTGPEVARIARMGALPRTMIELICGNGAWLQIPEVRRALLGNPRLGTDQIMKVLRLTPKHELRMVPQQTAYTTAVRDVARRLLRTQD